MDKRCPNLYQRARLSTGLTQERAAELLNLSPESLKQYEGGRRIPPDETVARMVEAYRCPWLALEHAQATDRLGVLPKAEPRPLPMASIALRNRLQDATGRLDALLRIAEDGVIDEAERPEFDSIVVELRETMAAIYQVIYSGAKRERPEAATSERSAGEISGVGSTTVGCINYSTRSTPHARPNFAGKGVSL
uniref:Helix-turn-helix XRE-family like protein n=1 Tax=Siphoviridae sp. ctEqU3 TaxID=2825399 RepID=A0A8S5P2C9_9CAUD|nr:MAG TPA: Helix-turn-helix XRE-family like protein [Siphoviridae sp. ctEqU3]